MTTTRGAAHFRLSGEGLTRIVRDLTAEGRWQTATAMLRDGLEGMTYDLAYQILAGDLALVGDEHEMMVRPDDATEHKKLLAYRYAGLLRWRDGRILRAYACVLSWGREDAVYAGYLPTVPIRNHTEFGQRRTMFYANAPTDCFIVIRDLAGRRQMHTLWAPWGDAAEGVPPWMPAPEHESGAYTAWIHGVSVGRIPEVRGGLEDRRSTPICIAEDGFPAETPPVPGVPRPIPVRTSEPRRVAPSRQQLLWALARHYRDGVKLAKDLRPRVLREVERSGTGWIRIPVGKLGAGFRVARAPFAMWACRSEAFDPDPRDVRDYQIQAHSGMRWGDAVDSAAHSDWLVSGGFTWFYLYQVGSWDPASRLAARFRDAVFRTALREVTDPNGNFVLNVGPPGTVCGCVVYPKIDEEVPAGSVIAVPNASADYAVPAMSAGPQGAVLTLDGGVLAHLTVVGMEMGFRVVRVTRLPVAGTQVAVYPNGQVLTVGGGGAGEAR